MNESPSIVLTAIFLGWLIVHPLFVFGSKKPGGAS